MTITRRDFLDGIAIGIGTLTVGCGRNNEEPPAAPLPEPLFAPERVPGYYPPALTGMRGSHDGSFEVAHQLRDGTLSMAAEWNGEGHDLIVVGAGISGLSAAHYWRRAKGEQARILILDNHDDFGGHAKRNEFTVGNRTLVSYGGTESIEYPSAYSEIAKKLIADIGIDIAAFPRQFPRPQHGLHATTLFTKETFGADRLVALDLDDVLGAEPGKPWPAALRAELAKAPLTDVVRAAIDKLRAPVDRFPKLSSAEQKVKLAKLSYRNFLVEVAGLPVGALPIFQTLTHSLYGVGIDAVPALDCWALEMPGFAGMRLDPKEPSPGLGKTPILEQHTDSNVQFADGNATVARLLVRRLIPAALPGSSTIDATTARLDYARLDEGPTKIRLSSMVIRVREAKGAVEVTYVRGGKAHVVRGGACVLACWNGVIPHLVHELPPAQKLALAYGVKVPLVYANVAIKNWRAFAKLGTHSIAIPNGYFTSARLELHGTQVAPDQPAVVKLVRTPCHPGGASRDQHRLGRTELLKTPFSKFEREIRDLFARMLGPGGFDDKDIVAITVNRWPHGYAYEYNSLWDDFAPGREPCVIGRAKFGRIAIANADAGAYAYTDCAIEQASRAVNELV